MKGKLIVIDGLDGSGKQTQTKLLYERLKQENFKVCTTSFPNYNSLTGELIKMYLSGKFGSLESVNAYQGSISYSMDRYLSYISDDWGKNYNDGYVVLCDRYTTSNMIHQGTKISDLENLKKYLYWLKDFEYGKLKIPVPDQILFLDVPINISINLMKNRLNKFTNGRDKDIHESNIQYLKNCYDISKFICQLENWDVINCTENEKMLDIDTINEKIYKKVMMNYE